MPEPIIFGEGKVVICGAKEHGTDFENEILFVDVGQKMCIGEDCPELTAVEIHNDDPRLLARLVFTNPDSASVLIEKLERVIDAFEKRDEEKEKKDRDFNAKQGEMMKTFRLGHGRDKLPGT